MSKYWTLETTGCKMKKILSSMKMIKRTLFDGNLTKFILFVQTIVYF